jgi:hypothetical protein
VKTGKPFVTNAIATQTFKQTPVGVAYKEAFLRTNNTDLHEGLKAGVEANSKALLEKFDERKWNKAPDPDAGAEQNNDNNREQEGSAPGMQP